MSAGLVDVLLAEVQRDPDALARLRAVVLPDVAEPIAAEPVAYTIASLAADLGVSEKVVRGAITRGELPAQRRGRRYLIDPDAARAWARPDAATRRRRTSASRGTGRPLRDALAQFDNTPNTTNGGVQR
jgi:excisionase family DNA binding protein